MHRAFVVRDVAAAARGRGTLLLARHGHARPQCVAGAVRVVTCTASRKPRAHTQADKIKASPPPLTPLCSNWGLAAAREVAEVQACVRLPVMVAVPPKVERVQTAKTSALLAPRPAAVTGGGPLPPRPKARMYSMFGSPRPRSRATNGLRGAEEPVGHSRVGVSSISFASPHARPPRPPQGVHRACGETDGMQEDALARRFFFCFEFAAL